MATMNVVYPHFHDTQSSRTSDTTTTASTNSNNKEIDIESSVYHLLSLYLNADALELAAQAAANQQQQQKKKHTKSSSPYWKSDKKFIHGKSWLGDDFLTAPKKKSKQELLLERNTMKNSSSYTIDTEDSSSVTTKNKKSRSKSVSFNETVTIISHDFKTSQQIINEDVDVFVDALESFCIEEN